MPDDSRDLLALSPLTKFGVHPTRAWRLLCRLGAP
jgi:hypothetical protein